jgi:hypothetical protein
MLLPAWALASEPKPEAEISFTDGALLVPNVSPVILLSGSDYDMGYQYYQQLEQLVQVYGPWILERLQRDLPERKQLL